MRILRAILGTLILGVRVDAATTVAPITLEPAKSIVFTITQTDSLWFFNGQSPDEYRTTIALNTAGPTQGQFSWNVLNNRSAVNFENGTPTITLPDTPAVQVLSAGFSVQPDDVEIDFKYNGTAVGVYKLTVFTPASVELIGEIQDVGINSISEGTGYKSLATFRILDQFEDEIPDALPINESFGLRVNDYPNNNWPSPAPVATIARRFSDTWRATEGIFGGLTPDPTPPSNQNIPVFRISQAYSVGSLAIGAGKKIEEHTVQFYTDHARFFPLP